MKDIKKYDIEFKHNKLPSVSPEYEIVKWNGNHCYTVAIFRYNEEEPGWYLESVGDRIIGMDPIEFMREVKKGFEYIENDLSGIVYLCRDLAPQNI